MTPKMIHRLQIDRMDKPFRAPKNLSFGWQSKRQSLSVWYKAGEPFDCEYIIASTGESIIGEIRATCVLEDGFTVFHLVQTPF